MSEFIHLIGSEQVERAGHEMVAAAKTMADALAWHSEALVRHQQFLDEWLVRFGDILLATDAGRRK